MARGGESRAHRREAMTVVAAMVRLMRPQQWIKNAVVLAGLVFAEMSDQPRAVVEAVLALIAFILASAAVYVINDLQDAEADRHHPAKRVRPIAAGVVSERQAALVAGALALGSMSLSLAVTPSLTAVILTYLLLMVGYTRWFKRIPILDVSIIAIGFVLRAVGGAVAVDVPISPWLLLCAFLLALFLGFGKRRAELIDLGVDAGRHRRALDGYTAPLLDQLVAISAVSALVTYGVYTLISASAPVSDVLVYTVPVVAFAIFRYLYLIYGKGLGGSPESLLFRDGWLLAAVVGWGVLALLLIQGSIDPGVLPLGNES